MLLALIVNLAHAETPPSSPAESADQIIERARAANRVDSAVQQIQMTVISKGGSERLREVELKNRSENGTTRTFMKVKSPSDVAGTEFLMIDNATGKDETYFYLPMIHKVTPVNSSNKKQHFIDSDLTMEDLSIRESANGAHTIASQTDTDWTIDTALTDSSYTKVRTVISKADLLVHRIEFYAGDTLAKTIDILKTEKDGTVNLPVETVVTDVARGTKTKLVITAHQLNVGKDVLPDETFTAAYLESGG